MRGLYTSVDWFNVFLVAIILVAFSLFGMGVSTIPTKESPLHRIKRRLEKIEENTGRSCP